MLEMRKFCVVLTLKKKSKIIKKIVLASES